MSEATPLGWKRTTFKSICRSLVNGGTPDTGNGKYWGGNTPWVTGADFTSSGIGEIRRYVSEAGVRSSSTNVVRAGNLLLVTRTGVGKLAIAPSDIAISQDITGIYLDENKADSGFVYFLMRQGVEDLKKRNQGTSINGIIRSDLEGYVVQIPCSLIEQKRIASILATLESAIEKTEALIAKYQQIKAGLMHDLFTRGVTADGKLRPPREQAPELYQETPIGWIPKEWGLDYLKNLTLKIVDGVHHTPNYVEHGVPFITIKNLTESQGIDFKQLNYVTLADHHEFIKRADPKPGDVLVTKDGTLGVSRIVEPYHPEFSIFVSVALLRPIASRLRPQMLHSFFDSGFYEHQMGGLSAGSGLKHIHLAHFRCFHIPLPSPNEQDRIAAITLVANERLTSEMLLLTKLRQQKSGLMSDLLTGHVRVKLAETEVVSA